MAQLRKVIAVDMAQEYLISKTKLDELEKELDYLKSVKRQEMAAVIKEALSHGDLSENSEYDEAKNAPEFKGYRRGIYFYRSCFYRMQSRSVFCRG